MEANLADLSLSAPFDKGVDEPRRLKASSTVSPFCRRCTMRCLPKQFSGHSVCQRGVLKANSHLCKRFQAKCTLSSDNSINLEYDSAD